MKTQKADGRMRRRCVREVVLFLIVLFFMAQPVRAETSYSGIPDIPEIRVTLPPASPEATRTPEDSGGESGTDPDLPETPTPLVPENLEPEELEDSLLREMELSSVQEAVDQLLEGRHFSFGQTMRALMNGDEVFSPSNLMRLFSGMILEGLGSERKLLIQLVLLVVACSFLSNFAGMFGEGQLVETSFYIVYLLIFALLLGNFQTAREDLSVTMEGLTGFMRVLTPSYYLAVAASSGASTAAMFYQLVLLAIWAVEALLLRLVLPGISLYVLLAMINHLTREEFLSHMTELLELAIRWVQKTALGALIGLQIIRGLIAPALDALRRSMVGRTAGAIPGIGNAINAVTELVLGSAVLIRNCFGATAMVVLLLAGTVPALALLARSVAYRLLAAFSQPVSDKRIAGCLATMGKGYALLLRMLCTVEVLFLLTIAILAGTFSE